MKHYSLTLLCAMMALTASAQTWKLNDLSADAFADGGSENWLIEHLMYQTRACEPFSAFGPLSTCNYVDLYQPERVGGQLFQDISADMEIHGEFTWALTRRDAWYEMEWTEPSRTDANAKFVYVSRAEMLGDIFEVCGNKEHNAIISFQATQTGFYRVEGSVIRQDGGNLKALQLIPRFRQDGLDYINDQMGLGLSFPFGEGGSVIEGATNTSLATGYNQRYTAQQPTDFRFALRMNEGDILSFEVSYRDLTTSNWPRDYYPRVFYRQLDVTLVDEATAREEANYVDPYDQGSLSRLTDKMSEYREQFRHFEAGNKPGQFTEEGLEAFEEAFDKIQYYIDEGVVNSLNADYYVEMLEEAWQALMRTMARVDVDAEGNFKLITSMPIVGTNELELMPDAEAFVANNDAPWGFYARVVADGTLEKFTKHDANNKSGEEAWYRGSGEWFYVTERGALHPLTDRAPGILFTAGEAGVYRFDLSAYRPNPNPKVENPLYVRCYVLTADMKRVQSHQAVLSKEYGSVKNDGADGKAPIDLAFYVGLQAGDRVFMEIDAYTSGSIASAGTQLLNLTACRFVTEGQLITAADAEASDELFVNPYTLGDATELRNTIAEAEQLLKDTEEKLGEADGQYDESLYLTLEETVAEAYDFIAVEGTPDGTQVRFDEMKYRLEEAIAALRQSKISYHLIVSGDYSISIVGTDKHLTQNNMAPGAAYYYANFFDADGVVSDAARFEEWEAEDYNWTFTFTPSEFDERYVHITSKDGWLTQDAYISTGDDPNPESHLLELVVENPEDEVFAVRRPDGLYWGTTMNWNAPYNRIATSKEPLYVFTLTSDTPMAITAPEAWPTANNQSSMVNGQSSKYYDLSGRRIASRESAGRGILIRRTIMADGSIRSERVLNP